MRTRLALIAATAIVAGALAGCDTPRPIPPCPTPTPLPTAPTSPMPTGTLYPLTLPSDATT